ncbi:MAG: fumarylacetoacetate hydrolase family protein [Coriobacteriia bacterium]|nr:fumarylacetoacetate hydrolase family protein [Coriobacteriia bacterium]MDI6843715.1 fumarylacetoacetate hydrolase family protein [Anaerosomatales bacterium]
MRVVRVFHDEDVRYGLADEGSVTLISDEPFAAWEPEAVVPLGHAQLLPPTIPTKVVCVGINYREHAREMGHSLPDEPVIFLKPPTSIVGPHGQIRIPDRLEAVDYEAELAAVIGRRTHRVSPIEAQKSILGFTCANDVTSRELQRKDGQWTRAKGFDTFCPLGPWIETDVDPRDVLVESYVNGELRQRARTSDMIFDVFTLVSFISHVMTLLPGDVVLTGTPSGVGPMRRGDVVEVRIEGVGSLVNHVA